MVVWYIVLSIFGVLLVWATCDRLQRKHAIIRNFPIIGHFRYWLETIGPELRQYIVTSNNEERPFSRDQRRWVYASSKKQNNYFGFGTDHDLEISPNRLIIKHSTFPLTSLREGDPGYDPTYQLPCAKTIGAARGRKKAFRPHSVVNISAMSYGSLSAPAVEALNRGCQIADCLHNTGEGGVAPYHQNGGELIWQIGTGYFGCRNAEGRFDEQQFKDVVASNPIAAIEIKLSQGAKPGLGGMLPAAKVTPEIAAIRGIPVGQSCASPSSHAEFSCVDGMLDFVERLAEISGLPIGIKSAVGEQTFWTELTKQMKATGRGVDFVAVDGGEGGTGAAPLTFSDFVALPFKLGFSRVYQTFVAANLHQEVGFIGSGKLGFPENSLLAMGMGCDMINVGREAMLAIGCIQAQRCHTGHCPTGVATQSRWLMSGLDPTHKAARLANYVVALRKEMLQLSQACGQPHPALVPLNQFEILDETFGSRSADQCFDYELGWGLPSTEDCAAIREIMQPTAEVASV